MEIQAQFEQSVEKSKQLTKRPGNDVLLALYGLFKQATLGDNSGERPSGFDFKAIAKYDAWMQQAGKPKEDCMKEYIELMDSLS